MATTQLGPNTISTVGELPAVGSQAPGFDLVDSKFQALTEAVHAHQHVWIQILLAQDGNLGQRTGQPFGGFGVDRIGHDNTFFCDQERGLVGIVRELPDIASDVFQTALGVLGGGGCLTKWSEMIS